MTIRTLKSVLASMVVAAGMVCGGLLTVDRARAEIFSVHDKWAVESIVVPDLGKTVAATSLFDDGMKVEFFADGSGYSLGLANDAWNLNPGEVVTFRLEFVDDIYDVRFTARSRSLLSIRGLPKEVLGQFLDNQPAVLWFGRERWNIDPRGLESAFGKVAAAMVLVNMR